MQKLLKIALVVCFVIASLYPAVGDVVKLTITSDSTWKALDVEQPGWISNGYDDSWWETASTSYVIRDNAKEIWYPGDILPDTAYFRKSFDINGNSFISGKLYVGVNSGDGSVDLYLNGNSLGKINNDERNPSEIDVLPYLLQGTNVIAAKVDSKSHSWTLSGTIRYEKTA
jgi:hypothetical protein